MNFAEISSIIFFCVELPSNVLNFSRIMFKLLFVTTLTSSLDFEANFQIESQGLNARLMDALTPFSLHKDPMSQGCIRF